MAEHAPVRAGLVNVPIGHDFGEAVVARVLSLCGDDPLAISRAILLLPNNRAIKAMTEAFVRSASPGLLLPRMAAVGDLVLDEALGPLIDPLGDDEPLLPVIGPTQRLMLLTDLVIRKRKAAGQAIFAAEAMRLARNLAELIDELEVEEIPSKQLFDQKPDGELAGHWEGAYRQLKQILPDYHKRLGELGLTSAATRRNALLDRLSRRVAAMPSDIPIIAAGITTAAPAVARLLRSIALHPSGQVVLPGLDREMADDQWQLLGPHKAEEGRRPPRNHETHPQFHLKLLLDRMGMRREEANQAAEPAPIARTVADIFCLPKQTAAWRGYNPQRKQLPHAEMFEAADSAEEARAISVRVREALETPAKRVALVTSDRELALRVAAQLERWGIDVDDSAGLPLGQTANGTLILAIAQAYADRFSPVSLLAIAKHPLVRAGEARTDWLAHVRRLDLALRGPSTGTGLHAIAPRLVKLEERLKWRGNVIAWWPEYEALLQPLSALDGISFVAVVNAIADLAETLTDGAIWRGATGRQLAGLWEEYLACDLSPLNGAERLALPAILTEMFGRAVVRPPYGGHPRVAILGLLEARLQHADLVICSGLNEGTWPQLPQPDPWLSPAIRNKLGLATLERNIGLSAHDLSVALGSPEILLTRAKRDRSGPTVASRFLLRTKAFLGDQLREADSLVGLATMLDKPSKTVPFAERPAPMPTKDQRKTGLSITDFDRLKADPYSIYAKRILKLGILDPVASQPSHAWRGTFVHDILEKWFKEDNCAPEALEQRASGLLANAELDPVLRALWQPRVMQGLVWVAEETARLIERGRRPLVAEIDGEIDIEGVTVRGRVDRIDRDADGNLVMIDYKTGQPPKPKQIKAGFALQLGLVGMMAEAGVIEGAKGSASGFEYWSLAKGKDGFGFLDDPTKKRDAVTADQFVITAIDNAEAAIAAWINGDEPFGAKLQPEFANYEDYDQLMRLQEWNGRQAVAEVPSDG